MKKIVMYYYLKFKSDNRYDKIKKLKKILILLINTFKLIVSQKC